MGLYGREGGWHNFLGLLGIADFFVLGSKRCEFTAKPFFCTSLPPLGSGMSWATWALATRMPRSSSSVCGQRR
eukprot:10954063-Alexandrium_andersonii.AAC.1